MQQFNLKKDCQKFTLMFDNKINYIEIQPENKIIDILEKKFNKHSSITTIRYFWENMILIVNPDC